MPKGVDVLVDEGFATISVPDKQQRGEVLGKILEHTPAQLVEKQTRSGPFVQYRIPEGNARAAGLLDKASGDNVVDRKDTGRAQDLVDADPQVSDRGGQHGEYRSPMSESTVKDIAYQAMPTNEGPVQDAHINRAAPQEANGIITAPLRPNKNVVDAEDVTGRPVMATPSAAELQKRIHDSTPRPADYAPQRVPLDQRVPSAQGTIASVVDRSPRGPGEPAAGVGVGPTAGRMAQLDGGNTEGDGAPVTTVAPDAPPLEDEKPAPKKAPAKKSARKAPAKKAAK